MRRRVLLATVVVAAMTALAGCGADDVPASAAAAPVVSTAPAPTTTYAPAPKVMPNLVGLTSSQADSVLVGIYPNSWTDVEPQPAPSDSTIASQDPAAGTPLTPENGKVTVHMVGGTPFTTGPAPSDDSDSGSSGSDSGGGHVHHSHVHVCVGHHLRVCS